MTTEQSASSAWRRRRFERLGMPGSPFEEGTRFVGVRREHLVVDYCEQPTAHGMRSRMTPPPRETPNDAPANGSPP